MLIFSKDDIILLQGLRIKQLDNVITELISVIATQYNIIHKPKRIRRAHGRLEKHTTANALRCTITEK